MEKWQLDQRRSLPLPVKEQLSMKRIKEWYEHYEGDVYVAFSGGKDSTVLLDLVRRLYKNVPAVFCDTGLEFPENRSFAKSTPNTIFIRPKMTFVEVLNHYGFPVVSKEQSQFLHEYRTTKSEKLKSIRWNGNKHGRGKISKKWRFLIYAPFKISDRCCNVMKKSPAKAYEKKTGRKPIIGTMADESALRYQKYLRFGCNAFDTNRPSSTPITFWTEEDIWAYIKKYNLPYSDVYNKGYKRTGCMFCLYGIHLEKEKLNRIQRMKQTHPKQYDYCLNKLGLKKVLDYMSIEY